MRKPLCAVVGVGEGNGAALARAFARTGMAVALLARRTDFTRDLAQKLSEARPYVCDISDPSSIAHAFATIRNEMGDPVILIYNAGSGAWGDVESITLDDFEAAWRVNAYGAFADPGHEGSRIGYHNFHRRDRVASRRTEDSRVRTGQGGATKPCRVHGPKPVATGIHVALIVIDAVVDLPGTRRNMSDKPDSIFLKPDDMAATAVWLAQQPPSAWTFEVEVRPYGEDW